jgi:hypothetical protein
VFCVPTSEFDSYEWDSIEGHTTIGGFVYVVVPAVGYDHNVEENDHLITWQPVGEPTPSLYGGGEPVSWQRDTQHLVGVIEV